MKNTLSVAIRLAISLALISGIEVLQSAAFSVGVVFNVLAWFCLLLVSRFEKEACERYMSRRALMWALTFFYWGALAYSNHPYLLASSVVVSTLIVATVGARLERLRKAEHDA